MIFHSTNTYSIELPIFLAELDTECFEKEKLTFQEWEKFFMKQKCWFVCWYEDNNKVVAAGVIIYSISGIAYLYSNAVLPQYRKQGLGELILKARLAFVKNIVTKVQAHTRVENKQCIGLLTRYGFETKQYLIDLFGDFEDGILWEYIVQ